MAASPFGINRADSVATPHKTRTGEELLALRYEATLPAKPPTKITVAPPSAPPAELHPAFRRPVSGLEDKDEWKRDSGLAPTTTSSKEREGSVNTLESNATNVLGVTINFEASPESPPKSTAVSVTGEQEPVSPQTTMSKSGSLSGAGSRWKKAGSTPHVRSTPTSAEDFSITTTIPTDRLLEEDFLDQLSFSKRGSMMLGGKKAVNGHARPSGGRRVPSISLLVSASPKVLSEDVEKESQKVRSMYESGSKYNWQEASKSDTDLPSKLHEPTGDEDAQSDGLLHPTRGDPGRPETALSIRSTHELAGGIEDWEDIRIDDVDRYGFINLNKRHSRPGTPEPRPPQRVSTILQLASETPRRRRTFGRSASLMSKSRRGPGRRASTKSLKTQNTQRTSSSRRSTRSGMRAAANHLPGNRDRRWMDEAGDMLTLPPGLADIAEEAEGGRAADSLKKKEWERSEKWRKMAKVVKSGQDGQGMEFEFDAKNPKLIERTWKGIPDRWRASAWYSFLNTSAKRDQDSHTTEDLIEVFHKLQDRPSGDDMQIDIDVPRTINSHIMFRRRYRGGQRLLFRVLHALALFFPDTGYVQGMASLAATLLCYYDEEKTFIMLTRMWTLRGLHQLYKEGFSGLMSALDEFQAHWLGESEVSTKLKDLLIEPTAYGTRWYLTLFNYSIPFQAQLRVWDVFMLLGDPDAIPSTDPKRPFNGGLDVLHATSAALIDGTREILLDSDFENAMKVLTSWIPVKDEELLMKVTKAEWKLHRGKKKT
ncbi:rab-GTPase-TBC domain-containing protein [Bisporella sp. PMI_857]|nr:rab-GTPase-TBC domain-containing protein [Bisporella sp. PMI_857]